MKGGDCVGRLSSLAIFLQSCIRTVFTGRQTTEVILDIPSSPPWSGKDFSTNVLLVRPMCLSYTSYCSSTHKPSLHKNICLVFNLVLHPPYVLQLWPSLGLGCQTSNITKHVLSLHDTITMAASM